MKFGMGQSVRRTEDIRFVTGQGRYTDDLRFDGELFVAFLRSPHGHAKITSIDTSAAKAAPGVVGVLTYEDIEAVGAAPMPLLAPIPSRDGSFAKSTAKPLLAKDKVTFAGEAIAMAVAETYAQACDAAELVAVEYEPLDAAGTLDSAATGPQIWDNAPNNLCFDWITGDEAGVNEAFANAPHTASIEVVQNRIVVNSMETRNAIALYDAVKDRYTLYSGTQGSAGLRDRIAKHVLNIPIEKLHVITPDVGGGFGMKGFMYPEQPLVLIAAKKFGRPVRWSSDRTEAFLADNHGRDMRTKAALALDAGGKILAMRITGSANMGGYLSQFAPFIPTLAGGRIFGGLYRVTKLFANIKGYFTNSAPIDAYRGAGRPEAAYLMER
ncbi:MAG TPA: molybdopterin cofactor-binding domain-containing protein, partial [Rhizomicrobium sp.]|nr:molybdopterin cofactor-binding domain-containing protein [Rhizomicrobium sp.]